MGLLIVLVITAFALSSSAVNAQTASEFDITASPSRAWIGSDGTAQYVITITSINNFQGQVQLSVSSITYSGLQTYFNFAPSLVQVSANSETYSILSLTTTNPSGYTGAIGIDTIDFQVIATGGGITKDIPLAADVMYGDLSTVKQTDLALSLSPDTLFVTSNVTSAVTQSATMTVTSESALDTGTSLFTGTLQAYDAPSGLFISFNPATIDIVAGRSSESSVTVLMTPEFLQNGGTYKFAVGITATVQGSQISTTLTSETFIITKITVLTIVIPPAFNLAVNPSVMNLLIGGGDQPLQITVTPLTKSLTEPIVLSVQGVPAGIISNFQTSTLIPSGSQPTSTNLVLDAPTGIQPVTTLIHITATAAGVTSSAIASLNVQPQGDYTLTADQATIEFNGAGQSKSVTLTITPQDGFNSKIAFSIPNLPAGVTAAFSTVNNTIQQSTPANVILTLTAGSAVQAGTYDVSVVTNTGFSQKSLVLTLLVRPGVSQIWPVVLIVVIVIAVLSLLVFVGLPRGREIHRIPEKEIDRPRLPS